jgi:hypothetical protein
MVLFTLLPPILDLPIDAVIEFLSAPHMVVASH